MADAEDAYGRMLARLRGVPGIDVDAGMAFLGNNVEMYAGLLRRFVALHEADVAALVGQKATEDGTRLQRLCHTIKGGAATLGLQGLAAVSQQLEQSLHDGAPRDRIGQLAQALAASHAKLKEQLEAPPAGGADGQGA
jgi:two-component system, sensor histidine kinase and response regulator